MSVVLDREGIEDLPHRDPFLFVDEIEELVAGERVVGMVRVRTRRGVSSKTRPGRVSSRRACSPRPWLKSVPSSS